MSEQRKKPERKHRPRTPKPRDSAKDYKYLQIKKLTRKFKPITINGIPISTIIKQAEKQDQDTQVSETVQPGKIDHVDNYLLNFIKNQPKQAIYISFIIYPSDPDFPFDMDNLKVSLCVPHNYPYNKTAKPSVYVLNDEIPRGYAVNIELGFKRIVELATSTETDEDIELVEGKGLLSQVKTLDKYLEMFLKQEKRQTIKIIKQKPQTSSAAPSSSSARQSPSPAPPVASRPVEVSKERLNEKQKLVQEMVNKLGGNVKLFNKNDQSEKYKVQFPINCSSLAESDLPQLWISNGKIELLLSITNDLQYTVAFPKNFARNLVKRYSDTNEPLEEVNAKFRDLLAFERNLVNNFNHYSFAKNSLIYILNYLSNNLNYFCLDRSDFDAYNSVVSQFKQSYVQL